MAYTESVGAPPGAADGDVWMRLPIRQPHIFRDPPGSWFGLLPEAGPSQQHLAKRNANNFDSQWVDPISGMATPFHQQTPALSWSFQHRLQFRFIDVTVVKAGADWFWDGAAWVDPMATTRPVTIVIPASVTLVNTNVVTLHFASAIAGIAYARR